MENLEKKTSRINEIWNCAEKSDKLNRERITLVIRNKNKKKTKKVMLFGAVKDLTDSNIDKDITIEVFESSHLLIKTRLLLVPIKIKGLRYKTNDRSNIFKNWEIGYENVIGELEKTSWCPTNYFSAYPENKDVRECFALDFKLNLTAEVFICFDMAPKSSLALEFIIEKDILIEAEENRRNNFFNSM